MTFSDALDLVLIAVPVIANLTVALTRGRFPGFAAWVQRIAPLVLVGLKPDREAKIAAMVEHAAALDPDHPIAELAREIRDGEIGGPP